MNRAELATLIGAAGGSAIGGITGYAATDKKRSRLVRLRNAVISAILGGVAGGAVGRIGNSQLDFARRRSAARKLPEGTKAVPGRVYYVSHPNNAIDISKTDIPWIDSSAARLKKLTGWGGKMKIGHAGLITVDKDGNAVRYDYGRYGKPSTELFKTKFNVKGMTDKQIAELIQKGTGHWGDTVDLYGTDVKDIGAAGRFMEGMMAGKDEFNPLPGGYSCGWAASNGFESSRSSLVGMLLNAIRGGFPSSSAPTYKTTHTRFTAGKAS